MAETSGEEKKSWADIQEDEEKKEKEEAELKAITEGLAETRPVNDGPIEIKNNRTLSEAFFAPEEIEVFNSDPNSPLFSAQKFEDLKLSEALIKGVYAMGFEKPSKIQERALPMILADPPQNLIAQAQSGTGKTAAFTLGMLSRVDTSMKAAQAICVSPTRELARQIASNVHLMGKFLTGLEIAIAVPGDNKFEKSKEPITSHVVVGTPGTLANMLKKKQIDPRKIRVLVVDEAEAMLDDSSLRQQTRSLPKMLPNTTQLLCFSATYRPDVLKIAEEIVSTGRRPYGKIVLKVTELSLDTVKQFYIDVGEESKKYEVLALIFGFINIGGGQTIIFVNTKVKGKELMQKLRADNHTVNLLTSDLMGSERDAIIDDYRNGKIKILLSTNVLARGIDILQIALVINYDLPVYSVGSNVPAGTPDSETYLHRCGRSARYGRPGVVINFVHDRKSLQVVKDIEAKLNKPIEEMQVGQIPELEGIMKKIRQ